METQRENTIGDRVCRIPQATRLAGLAACALLLGGCAMVRQAAMNNVADALAGTGVGSGDENDPDLVREAAPFGLKLMESVLAEVPRHRRLLVATSSGFTQYAFAFLKQDADELEDADVDRALALRARAKLLLLRARDHGIRALEIDHRDFGARLRGDPTEAVKVLGAGDVPALYWTGAAWGAAISLGKDDPDLIGDLPIVDALMSRALELDEGFDGGAIHGFFIAFELARPLAGGDPVARAREHFDRALAIGGKNNAGLYVGLAEAVALSEQNKAEFLSLLRRALEVDLDAAPDMRLANIVYQRRARWLLGRVDRLFLE